MEGTVYIDAYFGKLTFRLPTSRSTMKFACEVRKRSAWNINCTDIDVSSRCRRWYSRSWFCVLPLSRLRRLSPLHFTIINPFSIRTFLLNYQSLSSFGHGMRSSPGNHLWPSSQSYWMQYRMRWTHKSHIKLINNPQIRLLKVYNYTVIDSSELMAKVRPNPNKIDALKQTLMSPVCFVRFSSLSW